MCGRSAFFIHGCQCCTAGDHSEPPVNGCSAGCVVISQENRLKLRVGDFLIVKSYEGKTLEEEHVGELEHVHPEIIDQ